MTVSPEHLDAPSACPVCDTPTGRDSTFCALCGAPVNLPVCPQCEAVNARGATQCWKCAARLAESLDAIERSGPKASARSSDSARKKEAIHDAAAASMRDEGSAAPALPVCNECGAINAVSALYCRTCNAPLERALELPAGDASALDAALDAQEEIDVPQHYIGTGFDDATEPDTPAATVRARWRAGWTILAALVLLVLPAAIAVGVYAHYRPAVVSRVVAATKMRLHLAQWAYVEDDGQSSPADASTRAPLVPTPTGIPDASRIPAAPTGIPGTSPIPAPLPPLAPPKPATIPDVAPPVPVPATASRPPGAPASAPPGGLAWERDDDFAPDRPRRGRGDRTTSVCTPEIVDQGLCRPEVR